MTDPDCRDIILPPSFLAFSASGKKKILSFFFQTVHSQIIVYIRAPTLCNENTDTLKIGPLNM